MTDCYRVELAAGAVKELKALPRDVVERVARDRSSKRSPITVRSHGSQVVSALTYAKEFTWRTL